MKFIFSLFLFYSVALVPFYVEASDRVLAYIEQIPAYVVINNNKITGSTIDILNEALKESDVDIQYQEIIWSRALYESIHKPNIILTGLNRNAFREDKFHWLYKVPVHTNRQRLFLWQLKSKSIENKKRGLKNASITVVQGDHKSKSYKSYVESLGFDANIYEVGSREQVIHMLFKGRVDYILGGEINNAGRIKSLGFDPEMVERVVEIPNTSHGVYIAMGKHTNIKLVNKIRKALVDLEQSGRVSEIMSQWLKKTDKTSPHEAM
ncbi:substrate-binding periplasmic protein [Colwellia psychrerythraea]|uniref:ABC-type transporter, periplasmic subunit family 3 n=1 Tax=Colwellia psychrerythraea TaxID=28229 RepID=A0A099KM95_COLPS|nr:ABC transporter substrate-binding protein [Colwellia psychrerythraea]KGJ91571.1 ABC-type transporter, periplasmic subunit family 3 [Colwellia psychrerythraea]